jgi:hypothetical protein
MHALTQGIVALQTPHQILREALNHANFQRKTKVAYLA